MNDRNLRLPICYILNLTVKYICHGQFPIIEQNFNFKLVLNTENSVDSVIHRHAEITRTGLKTIKILDGIIRFGKSCNRQQESQDNM